MFIKWFFIFLFIGSFHQQLFAAGPQCQNNLRKLSYYRQIVDSKGLRLFIKDSDTTPIEKQWGGVIRRVPKDQMDRSWKISKYLRYSIKTLPLRIFPIENYKEYELTPLKALYEQTIVRPSHWLSKKVSNRLQEPAFFARLPLALILSFAVWNHIDHYFEHRVESNIAQNIQQYSNTYENLVKNDFRFRHIKSELSSGKINHEVAMQRAYWQELALAEYFKFRDANKEETLTLDNELKLINHSLFNHLKTVITDGVLPMEGFVVAEKSIGPLKDEQKLQLFKLNHALNLRYQFIVESINKTSLFEQNQSDPEIQKLLSLTFDTAFAKNLQSLANSGQITKGQLLYSLQEDAYWQTRFAEWATIGVIKLKIVDGKYSKTPLEIDDIRQEILLQILGINPQT